MSEDKMTMTIIANNNEDKLTQRQWASLVRDIHRLSTWYQCLFSGGSDILSDKQTYCLILEFPISYLGETRRELQRIIERHHHDSISIITGNIVTL